jgi:hypothetical protein
VLHGPVTPATSVKAFVKRVYLPRIKFKAKKALVVANNNNRKC